VTFSVN